ncbi:MAG: glycosyltransferase family 39 protein [Chloroflexi bacterium]|nr:glycosyltransferase family 39 protein [Chloroflexota bacterium]
MSAALAWTRQRWVSWAGERTGTELRLLVVILAIAAILRLLWVLYAAREPQGVHDPTFYFGYGQAIAEGIGYELPAVGSIAAGPTAYYPIGYPAALGAVFALVTHTPIPDNLVLTMGFFQLFLGVATVAMVYEVGRRLFGPQVGLVAGLLLAVFPNLIFHTAAFLTETLFMFLVMAALLVLLWEDWRERPPGLPRLMSFGLLLGASVLVRPISLLFLPLLPVVWLVARVGWQRALLDTGVVLIVTVAVIAPWSVRNFIRMDSPVIISTNLGDNLCIGHHAGAPGSFALPPSCFPEDADADAGIDRAEFEVRRNNDNIEKAVEFALANPAAELKLLSRKAYYLWRQDHDGLWAVESFGENSFMDDSVRTALERVADVFFFVTISLGGLGLAGLVSRPADGRRWYFLLALLSLAGIPLVFFGDARFHVPVMPLLVVPAAWVVVSSVTFLRKRYVS